MVRPSPRFSKTPRQWGSVPSASTPAALLRPRHPVQYQPDSLHLLRTAEKACYLNSDKVLSVFAHLVCQLSPRTGTSTKHSVRSAAYPCGCLCSEHEEDATIPLLHKLEKRGLPPGLYSIPGVDRRPPDRIRAFPFSPSAIAPVALSVRHKREPACLGATDTDTSSQPKNDSRSTPEVDLALVSSVSTCAPRKAP